MATRSPALHAQLEQRVGRPADLLGELGVGERAGVAGLALPVVGDLVAVAGLDVPVQAVVGDVELAADEPLGEGRVGPVEDLVPLLLPGEPRGPASPRTPSRSRAASLVGVRPTLACAASSSGGGNDRPSRWVDSLMLGYLPFGAPPTGSPRRGVGSRAHRRTPGACRVSPVRRRRLARLCRRGLAGAAARQAAVAARVPGRPRSGCSPRRRPAAVPAALLADPAWTAARLAERAVRTGTDDRRVLATVWWYSASSVLLTPALAGLVTGRPLSARLADTTLSVAGRRAAGRGDVVRAGRWTPAAELRDALAAVVGRGGRGRADARAAAVGDRDRLAGQPAAGASAGRSGDVPRATALAGPLAAAIGAPLPAPRYVDVARRAGSPAGRRAACSTGCPASRCARPARAVRPRSARSCSRNRLPAAGARPHGQEEHRVAELVPEVALGDRGVVGPAAPGRRRPPPRAAAGGWPRARAAR